MVNFGLSPDVIFEPQAGDEDKLIYLGVYSQGNLIGFRTMDATADKTSQMGFFRKERFLSK